MLMATIFARSPATSEIPEVATAPIRFLASAEAAPVISKAG